MPHDLDSPEADVSPTFQRMMIEIELGSNLKIGRLTDAQFRCLITGVWALAAKADPRGYLVVAGEPATAQDVAHQAHCNVRVAQQTMNVLRSMEMIEMDEDLGVEFCHDWWRINPDPKPDPTNAERQARWRERRRAAHNAARNGASNAPVTAGVTPNVTAGVTPGVTPPEVKKKEKVGANAPTSMSNRASDVRLLFEFWQEQCGHPQAILDAKRRTAIEGRLRDGYTVEQIRTGILGAARAAYVNDAGKRFDDIELVCRNAVKLDSFIDRASKVVQLGGQKSRSQSGTDYDKAAGL